MKAFIFIATLAASASAIRYAVSLCRRPTVDDLVAVVFWTWLMIWGLILL